MNEPVHHPFEQGSPEWHALRAHHYTASEAADMLGTGRHGTRAKLLRKKATGADDELFAPVAEEGHRLEAQARKLAEEILGEELYPATVTREVDGLPLLASCDGLTMLGEFVWEHKQYRADVAHLVEDSVVPDEYRPQLEQQIIVTGASRALFMMSDDTHCVWCWYRPDPDLAARIIAGWKQFAVDLANYQHVETAPVPVAVAPDSLPALLIDIEGAVRDTNLATYQQVVLARVQAINTDLQTDQDFADAEAMVKFLDKGEKEIESALDRAIAQTVSIEELFKVARGLKESMRAKRLELDKLVKGRKEAIRWEIVEAARDELMAYVAQLISGIDGRVQAPGVPADFSATVVASMKGKRTVATLRDAAHQAVTDAKLKLNDEVARIAANLKAYDGLSDQAPHLFHDLNALVRKAPDDFIAAVKARIAEAAERERARAEAERERIRAEEEARARRLAEEEARAKAQAEVADQRASEVVKAPPAPKPTPVQTESESLEQAPPARPGSIPASSPSRSYDLGPWEAVAAEDFVMLRTRASQPVMAASIEEATRLRDELTAALAVARRYVDRREAAC